MDKNIIRFEFSWKLFWQIFIFAALFLVFYLARNVWAVLLVSMIIAIGLEPVISFLERLKIGRILGTVLVFLASIAAVSFSAYFIAPLVISELTGFLEVVNRVLSSLTGVALPTAIINSIDISLKDSLSFITTTGLSSISGITGAIGSIISNIVLFLAMIIISFYLMLDKEGVDRMLEVILPNTYEKPVLVVFRRFKEKIRKWLGAQILMSLVIFILVTAGLYLLDVRYFLILGIIAGLLEIVPVIGPIIAGALTFLVAVSDSLSLGLYSLIFFFIVQQLENHILIPFVMGKHLNVHPVVVMVSLLAGGKIAGLTGVVLSVPIAVLVQVVFSYLSDERQKRLSVSS